MKRSAEPESVVQPWVAACSFKEQTVLLLALRGCDTVAKHSAGKAVTRALRRIVLKNAMTDPSAFMTDQPYAPGLDQGEVDGAPHHWLMHLIHAAEVVGFRHPDSGLRASWRDWYVDACQQMHMSPETEAEMRARLAGDHGPAL